MTKDEKKEAKLKYYATTSGKAVKKALLMSKLCAYLLSIYGVYLLVDTILHSSSVLSYVYSGCVIFAGIIMILMERKVFIKKMSLFVVKES